MNRRERGETERWSVIKKVKGDDDKDEQASTKTPQETQEKADPVIKEGSGRERENVVQQRTILGPLREGKT